MSKRLQRHIRWNWEKSPDMTDIDEIQGVRYHFVVVDDKHRRGTMDKILRQLSEFGTLDPIRTHEGTDTQTKFRYLFETYDSTIAPRMLDLKKLNKPIIYDNNLCERQRGNIEDYVKRVYER